MPLAPLWISGHPALPLLGVISEGDLSWPLRRAANLFPDAVGVSDRGRAVTYRQLQRRVYGLGAALTEIGVSAGGRVGYLGVNSLPHLECWLAVPAYGRALVDLNFRLAAEELVYMADDAGIQLLVVDPELLDVGRELHARCEGLRHLVADAPDAPPGCLRYEDLVARPPSVPPVEAGRDSLAAIAYTGGTTGTPKGVMLTHGNLLANARHDLIATGHRHEDRFLHVCPMFHVAGTANVFACTWVGAGQVVLPRFDPGAVAEAIARHRISHTLLVPTMLGILLDAPDIDVADLSSLRNLQYAASPISPELQRRVLDRFGCEVAQFYGMTEAAPTVAHLSPEVHRLGYEGCGPHEERLASIGLPVPGVEAEVRDSAGNAVAPADVGELWVRGPNIMLGYWNQPKASDEVLIDGWYRSGDAAYADEDGFLYIVDRLKDMIITGAENVYSIEVEAVLACHEDVLEAAVFAVPHERWGEAVHAVVTVRPGVEVSNEELRRHCRRCIAGFKVPRTIDVQHEPLPKSGAGKVLKHRLREPYWKGTSRWVS